MAEISNEKLEEEIRWLAGNQARIALQEIRTGKTIGEAVWLAKSHPQEPEPKQGLTDKEKVAAVSGIAAICGELSDSR